MVSPRTTKEEPSPAATILWWLRRPGHERQLTDCLGELARVDTAVAHGLADALLQAAATHGLAERAETLLDRLPGELTCSREEVTGKVVVRERLWWREEEEPPRPIGLGVPSARSGSLKARLRVSGGGQDRRGRSQA